MSFAAAGRAIINGAAAGLYKAGTEIIAESDAVVPVEFGTLKRSARVEEPVVEGDSMTVTIGYGFGTETGPDGEMASGYAIYVHEIARNKHAPPTMYKFLEIPARAFEPELGAVVTDEIKRHARGGT